MDAYEVRETDERKMGRRQVEIVYTTNDMVLKTSDDRPFEITPAKLVALMNAAHKQGYNHRQLHEHGVLLEPVYP